MKIRTDFVTNSSSSSFVAIVKVYTKDNKCFSIEGKNKDPFRALELDDDTDTEAWFNEELKDVLNCDSVDSLSALLYSSIHGHGLRDTLDTKNEYKTFNEELKESANSINDITRVAFIREYSGWGDQASCYVINDEEFMDLYNKYMSSKNEEDKQNLISYINETHPSNIWKDHEFASSPVFKKVGYFWSGNLPIENAIENDYEHGYEFQELEIDEKIIKTFAVMDLDQQSEYEEIFNDIRKRVCGERIENHTQREILSYKGKLISFSDGVYEYLTQLINNHDSDNILNSLKSIGLDKYCSNSNQTKELLLSLKNLNDSKTIISDEGELILLLQYLSGKDVDQALFGNKLRYTVGSITVMLDDFATVQDDIFSINALVSIIKNNSLKIVADKTSNNQSVVHIINCEEMIFEEYERFQEKLKRHKIYAIVRNRFTNTHYLMVKNPKKKPVMIPIGTLDDSIMKCIPNFESEKWNEIDSDQIVSPDAFCCITQKENQVQEFNKDVESCKQPIKTSGTGLKVRVGFPDNTAYEYNCFEDLTVGTRVYVSGKKATMLGVIEEIIGPSVSDPYMRDVIYVVPGNDRNEEINMDAMVKNPFVERANIPSFKHITETKYTNAQREELWNVETLKIKYNLRNLRPNCLKGKLYTTHYLADEQYKDIRVIMGYCKAQYKSNVTKKTDYFIAEKENQAGDHKADTASRYKEQGAELVIVTPEELMTILRELS